MKKSMDILPPYPPKKHHRYATPEKKRKRLGKKVLIGMLIVVFVLIIFFGFGKLQYFTGEPAANTENTGSEPTTKSQPSSNKFELFNDQGQSNLVGDNLTTIKLLNGTNNDDLLSQAKSLLAKAGFQKISTEKAANPYDKTIINYKKAQLKQAQTAAEALKPIFEVSLQESSNLDKNTDILIIIGVK